MLARAACPAGWKQHRPVRDEAEVFEFLSLAVSAVSGLAGAVIKPRRPRKTPKKHAIIGRFAHREAASRTCCNEVSRCA